QGMLPLLGRHGIRWLATDEEILGASTQGFVSRDARGHVRNPSHMYRPYKVAEGGYELGIVFRDHALSDMIGFHYQRSEPEAAAADFIHHIEAIRQAVGPTETALVSVILDGENCWEHYPGGGVQFVRCLYQRCCQTPHLRPVSIGRYLEEHPPRDTLPRLFAGSWIHHNFAIWIGHDEDNTAWDLLHRTREHLVQRSEKEAARAAEASGEAAAAATRSAALAKAWEEVYIAEGSDWFWWFGDDHSSAQDALFDYLFRKHLQNVYLLLGDKPPPELSRPICRRTQRAIHTLPTAFSHVKVNGRRTFFEWINAGHYACQNERGTMAMVSRGPLKDVYFGFNLHHLYIRIDFDAPARTALADYEAIRIGFLEPAEYEIIIPKLSESPSKAYLLCNGQAVDVAGLEVGIDQIVEVGVPFAALGVSAHQSVQFFVELLQGQQSRDRAPREGAIQLKCPSAEFEQIMWDV
ncbi:MAG: hypothetical protein RMJ52_14070, partial [Gemmataceae bacterium]|nr:hypothetical protein [Gemmataceae bacterium]